MKAFVVERYGKDGLRAAEVPEHEVGDGDVLVKVSAASINPLDKMVRDGEFKRLLKYRTPFVLGHDVAGVVRWAPRSRWTICACAGGLRADARSLRAKRERPRRSRSFWSSLSFRAAALRWRTSSAPGACARP